MGAYHGVEQADAPRYRWCDKLRRRTQQPRPEEEGPCRGKRKPEALEQPQREQRIHDQPAGKCIYRKQRGKSEHDGTRRSQRRWRRDPLRRRLLRQPRIQQPDQGADAAIGDEHTAQRRQAVDASARQQIRHRGRECTDRRAKRPRQTVVRKHPDPPLALGRQRQARMLQRQEYADIAPARIQRADEGHQQQRPEVRQAGEAQASRRHQQGRGQQQEARRGMMSPGTERQRRQRRTEQGRRAQQSDMPEIVAQRQQVGRQQHRNVTVDESAQAAGKQQPANVLQWNRISHRTSGLPLTGSMLADAGNAMRKTLPWPGALLTSMRPPWASTAQRAIANPRPKPPASRLRAGSIR